MRKKIKYYLASGSFFQLLLLLWKKYFLSVGFYFVSKNVPPGLFELHIKNVLVEEGIPLLPKKVSQYVSQFTTDVSIILAQLLSCNSFRSFSTDLTNNKT